VGGVVLIETVMANGVISAIWNLSYDLSGGILHRLVRPVVVYGFIARQFTK
jgi:hypothetical protein